MRYDLSYENKCLFNKDICVSSAECLVLILKKLK